MQHIVYLLLHDAETLEPGMSLAKAFPHLEELGSEIVAALPEPRLIKIHLPVELAPFAASAKYVYVARNPFDCAVSFYHHTRGFERHYDFADGTFDDYFECFLCGEVDFGDYFDNLLPWYALRNEPNVHFLTYEDLKRNTAGEIAKVGRFLGGSAARVVADAALLGQIIEHSSFERMSGNQQRWSSARPESMPDFVRKGIVGDWENHFCADQLARLLARAEARCAGSDVLDLWPAVFAAVRDRLR